MFPWLVSHFQKRKFYSLTLSLFLIPWFMFLVSNPIRGNAQDNTWSQPINLTNTDTGSDWPSMTADPFGIVHLAWQEEVEPDNNVIMYSQLENGKWTTPIDVIASTDGSVVQTPVLASDSKGYLHIVYSAGGIKYRQVFTSLVLSSQNWQHEIEIFPAVNYLSPPDLAIGPDDQLYAVVAIENSEGSGIYLMSSVDGLNWGSPTSVFSNQSSNHQVRQPRIAVDSDNRIHIVWVEHNYPETYPPIGIRYISSSNGVDWEAPISIADGPYLDPAINVQRKDEVHIVWSGTADDRHKFHRWSNDGGKNWSTINNNPYLGGLFGYPSLIVDGQQQLHWIVSGDYLGDQKGSSSTGYLFQYLFKNYEWSAGTLLMRTPSEVTDQNMSMVTASVSLGNQLHVVVVDPRLKANGEWQMDLFYLHNTLNFPADPQQELPSITPIPEPTKIQPTITITPTSPVFQEKEQQTRPNQWRGLAIGLVPSILLILVVVLVALNQKRK